MDDSDELAKFITERMRADKVPWLSVAVLGEVIARVACVPYESYIHQELLSPLGMVHTGFDYDRTGPCHAGPPPDLGGGSGFFSVMRLYPDRDLGVVLMGNTTRSDHEKILDMITATQW